jgi:hypothetical protein
MFPSGWPRPWGTASPAPTPPPPPIDGFQPPSLDEIEWHDNDVRNWPVTSPIDEARASWSNGNQSFPHPKTNSWPAVGSGHGQVNANPWIIFQHGGQWHAMTWEWLGIGQTSKFLPASGNSGFPGHLSYPDRVAGWPGPQSGQFYGWLVTSIARHGQHTVDERSQIVWRKF